ncbi:hypothetical protein [Shewanella waksmanii]|uniref:hypothetical protein n=1 Tax=Shewanella waksmanii TaxID=213783 RepID=UPI00048C4B5E|nr:hypothetical protein [Shewanella waksmanii]
MNAKKALKKLKKSGKKANEKTIKQLDALQKRIIELEVANLELRDELKQMSQHATQSTTSQTSMPQIASPSVPDSNEQRLTPPPIAKTKPAKIATVTQLLPSAAQVLVGQVPYKASPCKKCPALCGGLCKCAMKKQRVG